MSVLTRVSPMDSLQREFDSALGRLFTGRGDHNGGYPAPYGVDVREDVDHLYVEAELPGFAKDDVNVTLENQTLTISAERKEQTRKPEKSDWLLNERRHSRFLRSFTLPPTVDQQTVNAKLQDGVLNITINKREESKPRKIAIS
jgi:HSP20 family protein